MPLSQDDRAEMQNIALGEILQVARKIEGHDRDRTNSEAKRFAQLLRNFVNERLDEVRKGESKRAA